MSQDKVIKVVIIESERGCGRKVNDIKEFTSKEEAENFTQEFNKGNNTEVTPDWYMYARILK